MNESFDLNQAADTQVLVILRHGPQGGSLLREGLDAALVAAAFGRNVSLVFMGEGVMALCRGQDVDALGQKATAATLEMLQMYDITDVRVEAAAMTSMGLSEDDLILPVLPLPAKALATVIAAAPLVLTF
ncbi:sulfurtransferase complex subunit TusC [Halomonas halocynthiae]|uniref:sulfurtransferase complex subunit TusC n=1 Tax=Halomonas halocynthiae TaxID=176290 RepID=UPI0004136859|nr:sulfurtransferase complex subunit TusC [Halomonas halocynthiae]